MSETILAYELALRALDARDLETTRLFIDIARVLRDVEPTVKPRGIGLFRRSSST
ncbi:MAG: hypothetical protein QW828_07660 [Candidatus Bathyarchaeia archaeon]